MECRVGSFSSQPIGQTRASEGEAVLSHEELWVQTAIGKMRDLGVEVSVAQERVLCGGISADQLKALSPCDVHTVLVEKIREFFLKNGVADCSEDFSSIMRDAITKANIIFFPRFSVLSLFQAIENKYVIPSNYSGGDEDSYFKDKRALQELFALIEKLPAHRVEDYCRSIELLLPSLNQEHLFASGEVIIKLMHFMLGVIKEEKRSCLSLAIVLQPFLAYLSPGDNLPKIASIVLAIPERERARVCEVSQYFLKIAGVFDFNLVDSRSLVLSFVWDCIYHSREERLKLLQCYLELIPKCDREDELLGFLSEPSRQRKRLSIYLNRLPECEKEKLIPSSCVQALVLDLHKLLAHQFTFSGTVRIGKKEIEFERAYPANVHAHLQNDIHAFYGEHHPIVRLLAKSMRHQFFTLDEVEETIAQDKMIALYGRFPDHVVGAVIFKKEDDYILARCNKGYGCGDFPGIQFHQVGDVDALLGWIVRFRYLREEDFIEASSLQLKPCSFPYLKQQHQKVGNCAVANYHSLERALLYLLELQKGASDEEARVISKAVHQKRARFSALQSLDQYLALFVRGGHRALFDPLTVAHLFMKLPTHRAIGNYEWERILKLEKWLYLTDFSPQEFQALKEAIKTVQGAGGRKRERTGVFGQMESVLARVERAESIIQGGKKEAAAEAFEKCLHELLYASEEDAKQLRHQLDQELCKLYSK